MAKDKPVLMQPWVWRDSWSGPSDDGYSLHLTRASRDKFVKDVYGDRSGAVPEEYPSAEGEPKTVLVDAATRKKIAATKCGLRLHGKPVWVEL